MLKTNINIRVCSCVQNVDKQAYIPCINVLCTDVLQFLVRYLVVMLLVEVKRKGQLYCCLRLPVCSHKYHHCEASYLELKAAVLEVV